MQNKAFIDEHGAAVAQEIIDSAPVEAVKFVYAFVSKETYYLKDDGLEWRVFHKKNWKPVAGFLMNSFSDSAYSINKLKAELHAHLGESANAGGLA